ncbi:MFS transporter [Kribbella sp. NPDC003505]|uniref:MFS transporter n=1 Tax=Kribbella sp. NPDC003505 TaxID=3154448 RepID=UPI0033B39DE6
MRTTFAALAAMTVSFGLNFSAGVFFAPAAAEYGLNASALTTAAALSTLLTGAAQPLVGRLLDGAGAKRILVLGLIFISASYLVLAVVTQTWQFIAAYTILGGLGFAGSSSLTVSTLIGRAYGADAGPALARAAVGINLGQLLMPWAATSLFVPIGVRGTYAVLGGVGLAVTAVLVCVLPNDPAATSLSGDKTRESLRGRGRVLTSFGLHAATMYVVVLMLPKHAAELGWSVAGAGRLVAVAALSAGITSAVVASLLRRGRRPEDLLRLLHLLRALSLGLLTVAQAPAGLVAAAVIFGMSSFPIIPLTMAVLSRGLDPHRMGRTLAPAWVTHQAAAASGLAIAVVIDRLTGSYRAFFALGLGLAAACLVLLRPHHEVLVKNQESTHERSAVRHR